MEGKSGTHDTAAAGAGGAVAVGAGALTGRLIRKCKKDKDSWQWECRANH